MSMTIKSDICVAARRILLAFATFGAVSCRGADGDVLAFWRFGGNGLASSAGGGTLLRGAGVTLTEDYAHFDGTTSAWLKTPAAIDLSSKVSVTFDFWVRPSCHGSILYEFDLNINTPPSLSCSYTAAPLRSYGNSEGQGKDGKLAGPNDIHTDGQWHHVAVVYRIAGYPDCMSLYVDGQDVGTSTDENYGLTALPNKVLNLGCRAMSSYNLTGDLDEFRITDGERSAAEIQALYSNGRDPHVSVGADQYVTDGLVALFDAQENASRGGAHDATATVWRNIAPNPPAGAPVELTMGTGAHWNGASALATDGTDAAASLENAFADFTTVEIACNLSGLDANRSIFECGDFSKRLFFSAGRIILNGEGVGGAAYWTQSSDVAGPRTFSLGVLSEDDIAFAIDAAVTDELDREGDGLVYGGTRFTLGARHCDQAGLCAAQGEFYNLRLYNRMLTPGEIRRNSFIDHIRYLGGVSDLSWRTNANGCVECRVNVRAAGGGLVRIGDGEPGFQVTEWFRLGSSITVTAIGGAGTAFFGWTGDTVTGEGRTVSVEVNSPVSLTAGFSESTNGLTHRWAGPADGDFLAAENWRDADNVVCTAPPGRASSVFIPRASESGTTSRPRISTAVEIARLAIGGGDGAGDAELVLASDETLTVTGSVNILSGTVTCTDLKRISMRVGGDFIVAAGAVVTADGRGRAADGPGSCQTGCTHGGVKGSLTDAVSTTPAYGAALHPSSFGSGSAAYRGGGAIRLEVAGTLALGGTLTASGMGDTGDFVAYTGAGGSVWVTAGGISGTGGVYADGGMFSVSYGGSGGRIAVWLTRKKADFSGFTGVLSALGGSFKYDGNTPYSGHGTICRGFADGRSELVLQNVRGKVCANAVRGYTTLPMADDGDGRRAYRDTAVRLGKYGVLKLTGDLVVSDLELGDETSVLCLQGHKLVIRSKDHQGTWKGTVVPDGGTVRWAPPSGLVISVY